jgi:PAS domain S-box-containing protein
MLPVAPDTAERTRTGVVLRRLWSRLFRRRSSLRLRLLVIVALSLLPGAVGLGLVGWRTSALLQQEAVNSARHVAHAAAGDVGELFDFTGTALKLLADRDAIRNADATACPSILQQAMTRLPWVTSMWVTDADGVSLCSDEPVGAMNRKGRTDFEQAMATSRLAVGTLRQGQASGELVIPISVPLLESGKRPRGTLGTAIRLSALTSAIAGFELAPDTALIVVDRDYTVLYRNLAPERFVGRRAPKALTDRIDRARAAGLLKAGISGPVTETSADGIERMFVLNILPRLDLLVIVGQERASITGKVSEQAWLLFASFLLFLLFAFGAVSTVIDRAVLPHFGRASRLLNDILNGRDVELPPRRRAGSEIDLMTARILRIARSFRHRNDALRDSNRRLNSILEHAVDGIVMIDARGTVQSFNQTAERIFQYRSDEVIGRNVSMLMPEPYRSAHDGYLSNYLATGHAKIIGIGRTVEGRRKDGSVFPMDLAVANVPDERGGRMFLGTVRDVTQRQLFEKQLRESQKMEGLGQLTGGIAHDFNNLLAVILGNLEIAADHVPAANAARAAIDSALRATDNATALTQRLLAFARRMPLKPQAVELNALIRDSVEMYRRTLGETIRVETQLSPRPLFVFIDTTQLQVALLNLAVNARDAMPKGGTLVVSSGAVAATNADGSASEEAVIAIRDNGIGMTAEVLAHATEPFFTTKEPGAGTSLGLSMVHGFAAQSGGALAVDSAPGEGTTVRLRLPLQAQEKVEIDEGIDPLEAAELRAPPGAGVLLVEDSPQVRDTVAAQLRRLGYVTLLAADGESAITILGSPVRIDIVLTDVVLPGSLNGFDVAHAARRLRPDTGIVCMSGYTNPLRGLDSADIAEFDLLPKPFTRHQMARALMRARR